MELLFRYYFESICNNLHGCVSNTHKVFVVTYYLKFYVILRNCNNKYINQYNENNSFSYFISNQNDNNEYNIVSIIFFVDNTKSYKDDSLRTMNQFLISADSLFRTHKNDIFQNCNVTDCSQSWISLDNIISSNLNTTNLIKFFSLATIFADY